MGKTNVVKILGILLIVLILNLIFTNTAQASVEADVSANGCNVGEDIKVTIDFKEAFAFEYDVSITFSDGTTNTKHGAGTAGFPDGKTKVFNAVSPGNASISINNLVLYDNATPPNVLNTITSLHTTVTITDPTPPPAENPPESSTDNTPTETTTTPVETTPPVTINFKDTNETMYTVRRVNVRQNYGTDSNIIQTLATGTKVTRTGIGDGTKDGYAWSRISYNGITGYMITSALTNEEPKPVEETPPPEEENPEEKPEDKQDEAQSTEQPTETDEAKIAALAEKFGTIPEVGINIMPFFFLGSCVACTALMLYIKK